MTVGFLPVAFDYESPANSLTVTRLPGNASLN